VVNLVDLARAFTPEDDELTLRQRDEEFEIRFNGWEVMSNRGSLSEKPSRGWFAKVWVGGPRGSSSVGWGWAIRFEQRSMRQVLTRALLSRSSSQQ
jgi:hypothetical protein